jgi:hypothetical protein
MCVKDCAIAAMVRVDDGRHILSDLSAQLITYIIRDCWAVVGSFALSMCYTYFSAGDRKLISFLLALHLY